MSNLRELFAKIEAAISAAEQRAGDLIDKGADALDQLSAWLRAQKAGLTAPEGAAQAVTVSKEDIETASALLQRCTAPAGEAAQHGLIAGDGRFAKLIFGVLSAFLEEWLSKQSGN